MSPVIPLAWFFLFKLLNQDTRDTGDFFFKIAEGLSYAKGSILLFGVLLLCTKACSKSVDTFATTFGVFLIFAGNDTSNDTVVKLYDFNAQLQTILNLIHPLVVHCSLYLTLLFLLKPKIIVSFYA